MDVIKIKRLWCWWIANKWNSIWWIWSNNSSQSSYWKISCSWGATANPREIWLQKRRQNQIADLTDLFGKIDFGQFLLQDTCLFGELLKQCSLWTFFKYINLLNIIKQTKLPSKYLYILINSIEYGHKGNKRLAVYK